MTIRAIILGLLLGLIVSAAAYFNDNVIRQTMLVGNHLPISVFGSAVFLLLLANPLLRILGARWPLRGTEVAMIVVVGLAACGWPGSGYFRGFNTITALPSHWEKTRTAWQANEVLSYVPGGAAEAAPGHVQDWSQLVRFLAASRDAEPGTLRAAIGESLPPDFGQMVTRLASRLGERTHLESSDQGRVLRGLNVALVRPTGPQALWRQAEAAGELPPLAEAPLSERASLLEAAATEREELAELEAERASAEAGESTDALDRTISLKRRDLQFLEMEAEHRERHANRAVLAAATQGVILPAPAGSGALAASGRPDPSTIETFVSGNQNAPWWPHELPWRAWFPPIQLWWSMALVLAAAALCMTLIVHPQWSKRELLPYPIARFVEEATEWKPGAWLPEVAKSRLFWTGFIALMAIHLINGLHVWFNWLPQIALTLDFQGLRTLFPNASSVSGSYAYFNPRLFLSVIAFSFFLTTSVSLSLGLSQAAFLMLGSAMLMYGMPVEINYFGAKHLNMLRFGAYVGFAAMILYTGRRYYLNVLGSAVGLPRAPETPASATWAMRGLILALLAAVFIIKSSGLGWTPAILFISLVLLIYLVLTRVVVETGLFFVQTWWMPPGILVGLFGFDAIGPTDYAILGLATLILVGDPRELVMPYLANALQIADRSANVKPVRAVPWLAVMLVTGFIVAGVATMTMQYRFGMSMVDGWAKGNLPQMTFDQLANFTSESASLGTLPEATAATGIMEKIGLIQPADGAYLWMAAGLVLVVATAAARLRLPWWPLHPVLFLVWGTYPINQFAFSFLLGWAVKASVVRTTGARGYHTVRPLMIGIIAGELLAGLGWIIVGVIYYMVTGTPPKRYTIFPM